jgi:hypothetical protein
MSPLSEKRNVPVKNLSGRFVILSPVTVRHVPLEEGFCIAGCGVSGLKSGYRKIDLNDPGD